MVEEGALICTLDDRDLRLDRIRWLSQQTQIQRQIQEALAGHDRAQVNVLGAQLDQARAQLELVEARLTRARIEAPFDGLVVSGDLSQRLGGPVEQGEVLFEMTPLDAYRVILEVDEARIGDVRPGQHGQLLLASLPQTPFGFTVAQVTPISTPREGRNFFRVEARLDTLVAQLRPNMEGVGKISVDRRRLVAIWTRDLTEWLRLWLWARWP
jgi:multidrug efflux pump subunit AcrA (membrane-fusion protein)